MKQGKTPERVAPGVYRVDAVGFSNGIPVALVEEGDKVTAFA